MCEPADDGCGGFKDGVKPVPKRTYPWGNDIVTPERCNIDGYRGGTIDVTALSASVFNHFPSTPPAFRRMCT